MIQELISSLLTQLTTDKMLADYKKKHRSNSSAFKPPKYNLGIVIFCMVFFGALFILTIFSSEDMLTKIFCYIVFGVFTVGAFFLILYGQNFLVLYEKGTITYRNIFRITRTYSIKDITHVYYKHSSYIHYVISENTVCARRTLSRVSGEHCPLYFPRKVSSPVLLHKLRDYRVQF